MRGLALSLLAFFVLNTVVQAEPVFPPLAGRVVDEAQALSAQIKAELTEMLAAHEQATQQQVVVVTLASLQGYDIADFGYQLGRHWGIGEKGKDTGALLIVVPGERKVRIEAGYGLEGVLTDALSHTIIQQEILPSFRAGRIEEGMVQGVHAMLSVLSGDQKFTPRAKDKQDRGGILLPLLMLLLFVFAPLYAFANPGGRRHRRRHLGYGIPGGYYGGGLGGGGLSGGGGFSGGGGSFGGGGASGDW